MSEQRVIKKYPNRRLYDTTKSQYITLTDIHDLIASGEAVSVEAVGQQLKAGTNCGSCQPEIKKLITTIIGGRVSAEAQA